MKQQESKLQINCVKWFRMQYPTVTIFSIPNGGNRNLVTAQILKAEGTLAGVADLQILRAANGYNGLFIEMKYGKGKQNENQKLFQQKCEAENYKYVVCASFDEFKNEVEQYLGATYNTSNTSQKRTG